MSEYHTPVLLDESVSALVGNPSGTYIDATFGGGGHTSEILSRLTPEGRVIAFDRDVDAIANKPSDPRLTLIHGNFRFVHNFLMEDFRSREDEEISVGDLRAKAKADGVLADLGVSSHQFDTPERGFSFRFDAPLDMRMDNQSGKTAADIVNGYEQADLARILRLYGEVENAGRIAALLVKSRPIATTFDLNKTLEPAAPKNAAHKFLPKVYQALRIEVNQEMRSLEKFLSEATECLRPGGKLVVITYQSLEDRMVKNFIRTGNIEGNLEKDIYGNVASPLRAVGRKPIIPSDEEIAANSRARSAKMRIAEKTEEEAKP